MFILHFWLFFFICKSGNVHVHVDFVNPVFTSCPSDITTSAQSGGTATVDWTVPTATDNSGVTPQLTSNHDPNSVFNLGTTSVHYTASDGSDNSASCFFDVNVIGKNAFKGSGNYW